MGEAMFVFLLGLSLFLGSHSLAIFGIRDGLVARLGLGAVKGLTSVASVLGLVLLVWGWSDARATMGILYVPPTTLKHLSLLLMLPVFPLLVTTYAPGRIRAAVKHPMLTAVKAWATAHLLANGLVADVVLFGAFLAWAVADRISLKRRGSPVSEPGPVRNDVIAVVVGLGLYVAFLFGVHQWLFGVAPIASMSR